MSGDWLKKVSWKAEGEKDEKEDEDEYVNLSQYYDAKTSRSPPLGSSPVKKPPLLESPPEKKPVDKKRIKVIRKGSAGSSDSSVFSSVSTHSLSSSACSPEQLKKKAERRIIKITKVLDKVIFQKKVLRP